MSALGYDLAFGQENPFEGEEGRILALAENLKNYKVKGSYDPIPNIDMYYDLDRLASMSKSKADFKRKLYEYLNS
jgi:hypothetical protein